MTESTRLYLCDCDVESCRDHPNCCRNGGNCCHTTDPSHELGAMRWFKGDTQFYKDSE